jgi:hypothetical protein
MYNNNGYVRTYVKHTTYSHTQNTDVHVYIQKHIHTVIMRSAFRNTTNHLAAANAA